MDAIELDDLSFFDTTDLHDVEDLLFLPRSDDAPTKPKKRIRKRHADEMRYLQATVADLTSQLSVLEAKKLDLVVCSKWEHIARRQAEEAQVAIQKNQRLKEALEEQLHLAQSLQKIFAKKTKVEALCDDVFVPCHLSMMDPIARAASMRTLLDAQYAKLESAFVQYGMVDMAAPYRRTDITDEDAYSRLLLTHVGAMVAPRPVAAVAASIWDFLQLETPVVMPSFMMKRLERVDEDVIYMQFVAFCPGIPDMRANYCIGRYMDGDRMSIVMRTIEIDEPCAHHAVSTGDSSQWMTMEPTEGGASTLIRLAEYIQFPDAPGQSLSQYVLQIFTRNQEALEALTFATLFPGSERPAMG
ncbi:hypothetical protein SPRG_11213 [Saprolegnia parasitica CBS 223.65]|uniref:START domain-containing protein n=1 Tax=Saprolegnia parasitica (strain CBS 223.65) TaxID=695850 RepID=A0A067CAF1_SAPPC|nr:hypothetical protein SPRG_11213 [Saprolegnia parasitica CBS 223.65]KDO23782.1 hypothetical protein SPRG_11213 [Saprolegnia parasitica CBS 223.65]|eukprot:XP_012205421.1 hypothetical protein SPRG_11213 [Saprolegnia parasitica CBS 223.65]